METKQTAAGAGNFWWLKHGAGKHSEPEISSSLAEYLEHEQEAEEAGDDVDIPSILEEISRLSAKSPLGQYQQDIGQLSIDEIMREAEKIYMESSKSFEQLSQRSKTSQNVSELSKSDHSTPTPKSLSPLPLDKKQQAAEAEAQDSSESLKAPIKEDQKEETTLSPISREYSLDFDSGTKFDLTIVSKLSDKIHQENQQNTPMITSRASKATEMSRSTSVQSPGQVGRNSNNLLQVLQLHHDDELVKKDGVIKMLLDDNKGLKEELKIAVSELDDLKQRQRNTGATELIQALEELKDTQEQKNALQLQLEATNKSHAELRCTCDELLTANNILERRVIDLDGVLTKYKSDLKAIQSIRDKLKENEFNSNKHLDQERAAAKQLKQQVEKDAKCILDLNRQIKEMERIIARKHPDSVSALIVASKYDENGARKMFEERIKSLEQEALLRDAQNSKVFKDVQEKFNQMKLKYESHIEDLELHVNDLKSQLKRKGDTYDVYTQTREYIDEKIPAKDSTNSESQTEPQQVLHERNVSTKAVKRIEVKEDAHLIATIRGYQTELATKEKLLGKVQKDLNELRKTNRRLQKEREGALRTNFAERKAPPTEAKPILATAAPPAVAAAGEGEGSIMRLERDRIRTQLTRVEGDYQALKAKRLQDLNTLQEAHEREMGNYLTNVTPLREKIELQAVSLTALKEQLMTAKEDLAVITVERDFLTNKLNCGVTSLLKDCHFDNGNDNEAICLRKKLNVLEMKYEERENRLRAIVHGLAQKTITNRTCEQCAERQQQLIGYKVELDQIIATLRCLQ